MVCDGRAPLHNLHPCYSRPPLEAFFEALRQRVKDEMDMQLRDSAQERMEDMNQQLMDYKKTLDDEKEEEIELRIDRAVTLARVAFDRELNDRNDREAQSAVPPL